MRRGRSREDARRGTRIATPAAIVAAGGSGERARASSALPKQFRSLAGRPMIHWSLDALTRAGCAPLVVVVPPAAVHEVSDVLGSYAGLVVVSGGDTRQRSVASGLEEVAAEEVVVHDAARPLIDPEMVSMVRAALDGADGAVVGVPMDETLKKVERGRVAATVERTGLWRSQTPQAFRTSVLRDCHTSALEDGVEVTDDAALLEHYGHSVAIVEGRRLNIKVTWPDDFALAEALLAARANEGGAS